MNTRQIIDYAVQDNAKEMRDALYSDIHDRVMNHLDAAKQAVAQNMFAQEEENESEEEESDED
jgi:hypothetical protein